MESKDPQNEPKKKPYTSPKLVPLGSVRDLTLKSGKTTDGGLTKAGGK